MDSIFKKLAEVTTVTWITLGALILLGIVLLAASKGAKKLSTKMIAHAALSIALSFVLSYIRLYRMPQGGSITPASMLPLIAFSYAYGVGPGMLAGLGYGLLQILQGAWIVHPVQALLDYPLAYAMLGLAGVARSLPAVRWGLFSGLIVVTVARLACATLSGVVFFADSFPDGNVFWGSLGYNLAYLGPDALICAVVAMIPGMGSAIGRLAKA